MDDVDIKIYLKYILKGGGEKHYLGIFTIDSFNILDIRRKKMQFDIIYR